MNEDSTHFDPRTPPEVRRVLEEVRTAGTRVVLRYGHTDTTPGQSKPAGVDWLEEYDVTGRVGRSMGPQKVPILLASARSSGGGAILSDCIVKIMTARGKRTLYQHPAYHQPRLTFGRVRNRGYREAVYADGELHAQFRKPGQAARWAARLGLTLEPKGAK